MQLCTFYILQAAALPMSAQACTLRARHVCMQQPESCVCTSADQAVALSLVGIVVPNPVESYLVHVYMDKQDVHTQAQHVAARKLLGSITTLAEC